MNTDKYTKQIKVAALLCAIYVALGAFGAHGLKAMLSEADLATYNTGLRYLIIHSLGLFFINLSYIVLEKYSPWPTRLFYIGFLMFSFSLILHATRQLIGIDINVFARIAPIGGLSFIAGWIMYFITLSKK